MSTAMLPRSRSTVFAVMVATRSPSARRISAGPVTSRTSATDDSGMAAPAPSEMFRFPRSATLSRNDSSARRRMSMERSSRWMSVATSPSTLERIRLPSWFTL